MSNMLEKIEQLVNDGKIIDAVDAELKRLKEENLKKQTDLDNSKRYNNKMFIITIISLIITALSLAVTIITAIL